MPSFAFVAGLAWRWHHRSQIPAAGPVAGELSSLGAGSQACAGNADESCLAADASPSPASQGPCSAVSPRTKGAVASLPTPPVAVHKPA